MLSIRRRGFETSRSPAKATLGLSALRPTLQQDGTVPSGDWKIPNPEIAAFPMEIIAPRTGRGAAYAWYKAYPGIQYERPVHVLWGSPPYKYALGGSPPPGMTIGETLPEDYLTNGPGQYGIIRWPNPVAGSYSITVNVTDQLDAVASVTYTLTVTTSGFIFVDPVNGHASAANGGGGSAGTGTLANPFLTFNDFYAGATGGTGADTRADTTYAGYIVYYRAGTTYLNTTYNEDDFRTSMRANAKPHVHIGYPGETVNLSFSGRAIDFYSNSVGEIYFGNMNFIDTGMWSDEVPQHVRFDGSQNDVTFFKLNVSTPAAPPTTGNNNASIFFSVNTSAGQYHSMSHCTFGGNRRHDIWLFYKDRKILVEWNTLTGAQEADPAHGFYWKDSNQNVCARFNIGLNASNSQHLFRIDGYNGGANNYDFAFNAYRTTGDAILWGSNPPGPVGTTWERRNTWYTGNPARISEFSGTLNTSNNVIRHGGSAIGAVGGFVVNGESSNLSQSSGLVDANLRLTGSDRTTYLNVKGHEIDIW